MNLQVMFSTDGYAFPETFYLGLLKLIFVTILPSLNLCLFLWKFITVKADSLS